jgi:titin
MYRMLFILGLLLTAMMGAEVTRASNQPPPTLHPLLQIEPVNTYVVTKTDDAGIQSKGAAGTLRWAMNQANASAGFDLIRFDLTGSGVQTITVKDWLPDLTDNAGVMIDGTQSDDRIQLDMGLANIYHDGISLRSHNNVIKGLIINNRPNGGVAIGTNDGASYNVIIGNYLGTNAAGTAAKKAMEGVHLREGSHDNVIGGTNGVTPGGACTGDCNLISGNYQHGIVIDHAYNNKVIGNFVGVNVNGNGGIPNNGVGVLVVNAPNNIIGGPNPQERNVISGNGNINVEIGQTDVATRNNVVQGNYIGTNSAGTAAIAGQNNGIVLDENSSQSTVDGNVISGNGSTGVLIFTGSSRNTIKNNLIGVAANGSTRLPNNGIGILIHTNNNLVTDNIIAYHQSDGVRIKNGTGNQIRRNSIYGNAKLGINVAVDGFTPNDNQDPDTGPNMLQNFPTLSGAGVNNGTMTIQGALNSRPNQKYTLDFYQNPVCDNTYNRHVGQGKNYLGSTDVNTNSSGNASFTTTLSTAISSGVVIATATDSSGNTSEFSECVNITSTLPVPPKPQLVSPDNGATVTNNPPLLDWNPSEYAVRYVVIIKQDAANGATVHNNKNVPNDQYTPPALAGGHTYFWRVKACNAENKCSKSVWYSFVVP